MIAETGKAFAVLGDKLLIIQLFIDDHSTHRQCHGTVCAGPDRHPFISFLCGLREVRINNHQSTTFRLSFNQVTAFPKALIGTQVVHAPKHHILRIDEVMHGKHMTEQR